MTDPGRIGPVGNPFRYFRGAGQAMYLGFQFFVETVCKVRAVRMVARMAARTQADILASRAVDRIDGSSSLSRSLSWGSLSCSCS
jgi:hypothetical protein